MADITSWIVTLVQIPLLLIWAGLALYLLFLTLGALVARFRERRIRPEPASATTRFTILVPAHDESVVINDCLRSLTTFRYPNQLRRVLVIADNCTDDTAEKARAMGADVYERSDSTKRGKGFALDWAIARLLQEDQGWTDAVVVFDADTRADPDFLSHMDVRLRSGSMALQGHYDLLNPFYNWRTALLYSALLLHNRLRPLARQALGWTTLLKGNGMCFSRGVMERFGWNAYSLTEDIEYTTTLLAAGIRVESVPQAILYAQAPQTAKQADSQRMRWEGGRFAMMKRTAGPMLRDFVQTRSLVKLDWAMDLLTPPTAILVGLPLILLGANELSRLLLGVPSSIVGWLWLAILTGVLTYVLGGLLISSARPKAYLYLLCTPIFLVWKLKVHAMMLMNRGVSGWVRTERTGMSEPS
ncbi:MAG TPA: glycosyltransferase family 2 protein [Chloroflexia bacterium]|nr:glycosyltransferase family 2 protein [Chloroflexia bacterium]